MANKRLSEFPGTVPTPRSSSGDFLWLLLMVCNVSALPSSNLTGVVVSGQRFSRGP